MRATINRTWMDVPSTADPTAIIPTMAKNRAKATWNEGCDLLLMQTIHTLGSGLPGAPAQRMTSLPIAYLESISCLTTLGSASVEISPRWSSSSSAILRKMRRIILQQVEGLKARIKMEDNPQLDS